MEGVVICVYPVKDDYMISGHLKRFTDMVFVDIGSNIGEYSLFAAAMGHRVLAVDMLPRNVQHMLMALRISKLESEVIIVNNALYFDHRVINVEIREHNVGGTEFKNSEPLTDNEKLDVHTICMDDLIPLLEGAQVFLKMDVENSELHALKGARKFFQKVNVQVVQMEWLPSRGKYRNSEIMKFMSTSGYVLSSSINEYISVDENNLIGDYFFLKKTVL